MQHLQLLASRDYTFIDAESLEERQARDALFRRGNGDFLLYMRGAGEERMIRLDPRSALAWINASPDDFGLEWE